MKSLAGKLALITGSTSGIGLGVAECLASQGANLILNGFGKAEDIEALQKRLADKYKVKIDFQSEDMSKRESIEAMFDSIHRKQPLDILVNNAGIQHVAPTESFPIDKWDAIININMNAVFHTTRLALPAMQKANWGRIINIASAHGLVASKGKAAYVTAKHGVVGFTKVVALENATSNVTANCICPGFVLTPLVSKQIEDRAAQLNISYEACKKEFLNEKQPSQEFVTPEQLGGLAVFLCSEAAKEVRGVAWNMDGGWVAQ